MTQDTAIKDKIKELVYRIENDHFPAIAQRDHDSDENIDLLLKDYSDTVGHMILRAKSAGLHYLSDSLELFWKFLIVALDKLFGIKQKQLENIFNDEVNNLNNQIYYLKDSLNENEKRFKNMTAYYENRVKRLIEKNRNLGVDIINMRNELEKHKTSIGMGLKESKETLVGRFEDMHQKMLSLTTTLDLAHEENRQQNQLVQKDLLKSIMGLFNKGFKCNAKQASTQTDLSLCANSLVVYKYGIEETVIPETRALAAFHHPFLSFLVADSDVKPRIEEQIDFVEQHLDLRTLA